MPNYSVLFLGIAQEELNEAKEYLDDIQLGDEFIQELDHLFSVLSDNPFLFQKVHEDKRQAILSKFRYKVIYEIFSDDQIILILAVIHESRNPERWQNR